MTFTNINKRGVLEEVVYGGLGPSGYPLGPPKTMQHLDERKFLRLLNDKESKSLRGWVDEWIDAGKRPDGFESAAQRHFTKGCSIRDVVCRYSQINRISLIGTGNAVYLHLSSYDERNEKPYVPGRLYPPRHDAEDIATEALVFFLLSDLRFRIAKCRRSECGKYFVLKYPNKEYKCGTKCNACQRVRSLESAKKVTSDARKNAKNLLHRLAAQRFGARIRQKAAWHRDAGIKASLVDFINLRIGQDELLQSVYRNGITAKWLSRAQNRNAIEAVVKEGK
jgi:hypothetical protein